MLLSIEVIVIIRPGEDVTPGMVMAVSFILANMGLIISIFKEEQALF